MKDKFQAQAQSDLTQTFSDSAMAQDPGNPTLVEEEIAAQIVSTLDQSQVVADQPEGRWTDETWELTLRWASVVSRLRVM